MSAISRKTEGGISSPFCMRQSPPRSPLYGPKMLLANAGPSRCGLNAEVKKRPVKDSVASSNSNSTSGPAYEPVKRRFKSAKFSNLKDRVHEAFVTAPSKQRDWRSKSARLA